jgi:hypothetical protein
MGTNTSFLIPKVDQEGRALWVFAKDLGHPDYFRVFNNNANSSVQVSNYSTPQLSFVMNSSLWNVSETTNFSSKNIFQLSGLSNVKFVNSLGRIDFIDNVSISRDIDFTDKVRVEDNYIFVNSSYLSEFNVSANLTFYNLVFNNPRILRDGIFCTDCVKLNYTNGTLVFNVSGFSTYTSEETPTCSDGLQNGDESGVDCGGSCSVCESGDDTSPGGGGGRGGGGGTATVNYVVKYDDLEIVVLRNISIGPENVISVPVSLENPANGHNLSGLNFSVSSNIDNLKVELDDSYIYKIYAGEVRVVNLIINSSGCEFGVYEVNLSVFIESLNVSEFVIISVSLDDGIKGSDNENTDGKAIFIDNVSAYFDFDYLSSIGTLKWIIITIGLLISVFIVVFFVKKRRDNFRVADMHKVSGIRRYNCYNDARNL